MKAPIPGEVKTRLLPYLESRESAELYSCFVKDLLRNASKISGVRLLVAYQPHTKLPDLSWTGIRPAPEFFKQEGKSLGERLTHAFGVAFGRGAQQAIIAGSDTPSLSTTRFGEAFTSLADADIVLGPTVDGGYYLIGLSRPSLRLFEEASWSTDQVFEWITKKAQAQRYKLRVLSTHYNVGTVDDLHRLRDELSKCPALAPQTEKWLGQLFKARLQLTNS